MSHHQHRRLIDQVIERFDWMIEEVRDEVHLSEVGELQRVLNASASRTSARERALVILGLLGTAEAHAVLQWFDPAGHHRRVSLLHRLAKRECARRRGATPRRANAGPARLAA